MGKIGFEMAKTNKRVPEPGDIFSVKLPDGQFGAIRILRAVPRTKKTKSFLVMTTQFLGQTKPTLDKPELLFPLVQNRFSFSGSKAICWLSGDLPDHLSFVGNIPLRSSEARAECSTYGFWGETEGFEVLWEWRWIHDRAALKKEFEEKAREADQRSARRVHKPNKMMNENEFWKIIALLDWKREGHDDAVLAPAVAALASKSKADICGFYERMAYLLYLLDTREHASNIGEYSYDAKDDYISADLFLYARCAAVANGRNIYGAALKSPSKMPKDLEFEALLNLAPTAYEEKTGEEFDYLTGCSFETFSNADGWK